MFTKSRWRTRSSAWLLIQVTRHGLPRLQSAGPGGDAGDRAPDPRISGRLVLAWAFELTPEGVVRAEDVAPGKSITRKTGRKLTVAIVLVGTAAAAMFAFQFVRPKTASTTNGEKAVISEKSIAVLPFENRSEDKANAYFADGIQDEILTRLAKIADLKVISRTSTEKYRSRPGNLKTVAEELGVAALLEGSVQKSGRQGARHRAVNRGQVRSSSLGRDL